jgi:pimeloyl-ACP methyl ester carboxylesterase
MNARLRTDHMTAVTQFVETNGIRFAYRKFGATSGIPLVFLQHFTGTMDMWDPSVVDGFASMRPVVLFDNAGVGGSGGATPNDIPTMAEHAAAFIGALGLTSVDLLGFSLGGFIAQLVAVRRPELVRRVILAGTGPEGGEGIQLLPQIIARGVQASPAEPRLFLFFDQTESSQSAGRAFMERQARRTNHRDLDTTQQAIGAQQEAIIAWGASTSRAGTARLQNLKQPVLVVNGKLDVMVPSINSYVLFQQLPDAKLILYPDSGHGALFQFADAFVRDGLQFLGENDV